MTEFEQDVIKRLAHIEAEVSGLGDFRADHETRMRSLEKRSWIAVGFAAVAPFLGIKLIP